MLNTYCSSFPHFIPFEGPLSSSQFTLSCSASVDIFVSPRPQLSAARHFQRGWTRRGSAGVLATITAGSQFPGCREDAYLFICLVF